MPAKPKTAAISAIIRKVTAQLNIFFLLLGLFRRTTQAAPHRHTLCITQRYDLSIKLHFTCHKHRLPLNFGPNTGDLYAYVLLQIEILAVQIPYWADLYTRALPIICLYQHLHTWGHTWERSAGIYTDYLSTYGLFLRRVIQPAIGCIHTPAATRFAARDINGLLTLFIDRGLLEHLWRQVQHQRLASAGNLDGLPGHNDALLTHPQKATHAHDGV